MKNLFVHIGMGTVVQRARILFVTELGTTTANRYVDEAKKAKPAKFHNATLGHKHRSLIVLDDGSVIISTITPMTLMKRLNSIDAPDDEPEEIEEIEELEEDEDEDEGDEPE